MSIGERVLRRAILPIFVSIALLALAVTCTSENSTPGLASPTPNVDPAAATLPAGDNISPAADQISPLVDSDGDGYTDLDELTGFGFDPNSNPYRFNPFISDLPIINVEITSPPSISIFCSAGSESAREFTTERSTEEARTVSSARSGENSQTVELGVSTGVEVGVSLAGPEAKLSYNVSASLSNTTMLGWSSEQARTNSRTFSDAQSYAESQNETCTGGSMAVTVEVRNEGHIAFTLENLVLTAATHHPIDPSRLDPVGNLLFDTAGSGIGEFPRTTLAPGGRISRVTFVNTTLPLGVVQALLRDSRNLTIQVASSEVTDPEGRSFLHSTTGILANTATVIIDYGFGTPVERYQVAASEDGQRGVTAGQAFSDYLSLPPGDGYETGTVLWDFGDGKPERMSEPGLIRVRSVAADATTNAYWAVAHTTNRGTGPETIYYSLLEGGYDFDSIELRAGDVLHLVYVMDKDGDGLPDRIEFLIGSDPLNPDADGDSLSDGVEHFGWLTNLTGPPCDVGGQLEQVRSNPLLADTNGDGIGDGEEFANCSNPYGELTVVEVSGDRLVSMGDPVALVASPVNFLDSGALEYEWTQTGGESVGRLAASPNIRFQAPEEVTTLVFQVSVTDPLQGDRAATNQVSVVVVRDKLKALFVDPTPNVGHDFNNTGRSPDSPLSTLRRALTLASAFDGGADVHLKTPDDGSFYTPRETMVLTSGTSVFGGFGENWVRDPANAPTPIRVNQAVAFEARQFSTVWLSGIRVEANAPVDGSAHSIAIRAQDGDRLILDRVIVKGSDLTVDPTVMSGGSESFISASSYGVFASGLNRLEVLGSTIQAGKGAAGPKGAPGAAGATGAAGKNGGVPAGGSGGSSQGGGEPGGRGGDGATLVVTCAVGKVGARGSGVVGGVAGGAGGAGGIAAGEVFTCRVGDGSSGASVTTRAATGSSGIAAEVSMDFDDGMFFIPRPGAPGGQGIRGAGGGGANFADGGGGGGGQGGGGGGGGFGGRGGGGSFALALYNVQFALITDSQIESAGGGDGGVGGRGGNGGLGGEGGKVSSDARSGGRGGSGGPGGHGGDGGGGAGGPTAGVLLFGDTEAEISGSRIITGDAGNGTGLNAGQGSWNYGVFMDESSTYRPQTGVTYELGASGNDAPPPAETN